MIKLVVFDAYGTLFDVYSIGALVERLYPGHGAAVSTLWRDKQIEYSRLITLSDPDGAAGGVRGSKAGSRHYQSFWELTRLSLRYALARHKLPWSEANEAALMQQYAQLTAFPENLGVLQALRDKGMPSAILSNGSPDMLASAVASAGMSGLLDRLISVDEVRQFKTAPQSYALVGKYFDVVPKEVLFVSSNAWDALGATWFGFATLWVNRQNLPPETLGPPPGAIAPDLRGVLDVLAKASAAG